MTTEEREKELQELDRKMRQQVQILLESKEGRDLWAGEIQFHSIQLNNRSVSIIYVDADGANLKRAGMVSRSQAMSGQMKGDRFLRLFA